MKTVARCNSMRMRTRTMSEQPWTTFSVGLPPYVDAFRQQAEDKIARVVFHRPDRKKMYKPELWEKILSAIALASDEKIREFFGDE